MPPAQFFFDSDSEAATKTIAEALGRLISDRCRIAFSGDLGAGKTHFVQGLAKGLGVPEDQYVTSPSYALIHSYPGRLPLHHADLYRLSDFDEIYDIGLLDLMEETAVTAVEWAERLHGEISFDLAIEMAVTNAWTRRIRVLAYGLQAEDLVRSWQQLTLKA